MYLPALSRLNGHLEGKNAGQASAHQVINPYEISEKKHMNTLGTVICIVKQMYSVKRSICQSIKSKKFELKILTKLQLECFAHRDLPYGNNYSDEVNVLSIHHRLSDHQSNLYKKQ